MLYLRKRHLETIDDIRASLLGAIRLELSTLPLYLTALYSIKPGTNNEIAKILRQVALQEMLHFCLMCNLLNAIGGRPTIAAADFAPRYPGPLPMGIGASPGKPFVASVRRFSIEIVRDVFMTIEEPEHSVTCEDDRVALPRGPHHTIGEFYAALGRAIAGRGKSIFTGDPKHQITGWFPADELFAITGPRSATRAIRIIVEQGEGTTTTPLDVERQLSHYYLFAEIANGRRLVRRANGWAFTGAKIAFDPAGVYPMVENPALVRLPARSTVAQVADRFDQTYTALLNALHVAVNGAPSHLNAAIGVMYTLRIVAQQLMEMRIPGKNVNAGPRWRYIPVSRPARDRSEAALT